MRMVAVVAAWALMGTMGIGGTGSQDAPAGGKTPTPPTPKDPVQDQKVTVEFSGPPSFYLRTRVSLILALVNSRKDPVKDGLATVLLPPELGYLESTPPGALYGQTVTFAMGDIPPESRKEVAFRFFGKSLGTARVAAVLTSESLRTPEGSRLSVGGTFDLKVVGIPALLVEVIDTEDPVKVGESTTYVIEVTNQGTAPDTSILLTYQLPAELGYVNAGGPVPFKHEDGKVSFEAVPILKPGEKAKYTVVCKGLREGDVRPRAILRSDSLGNKPITEEESTQVYR